MDSLNSISLDLTNALVPLMAIFLSLGLGFFIKDLITNFITGIKFKFDASFNEGDRCIVDEIEQY